MRRIGRLLLLSLIAFAAPACYQYTPVLSPERGMEVRATLETDAAVRRSQGLDNAILCYDGVVVDITPAALSLDVLVARSTTAFQDVTIRDTITLETAEVRSIMRRKISPVRTALFAVAAGVAGFGVVKSIDAIVGGTDDDDDGNRPPPAMRIPVFSWPSLRLFPAFLHPGKDE
jgi:hypothetical protein